MIVHPSAGASSTRNRVDDLVDLLNDYYERRPDPTDGAERVTFGTSGHRGSSTARTFNEAHVLAITQAICDYRKAHAIGGPLYLGRDTHALSAPAFETTLEVLAANGVQTMIDDRGGYTPTPAISHAILTHNRGRAEGSPMASSSRRRTIRRRTEASSTTRRPAVRRIQRSRAGSRTAPTS